MDAPIEITLSKSGLVARLTGSDFHSGVDLVVDEVVQSNVDLEKPTKLNIRYIKHLAGMIDCFFEKEKPLSVLHLGAGGMTLARYIGHTRSGSVQTVIELEEDIVELVTSNLPLDVEVEIIYGDAREVVEAMSGITFDLIISDVYSGIHTPAHATTLEFYLALKKLLAPNGIILVNSTSEVETGLKPIYNQYFTVNEVFGSVMGAVDTRSMAEGEEANVLIAGAVTEEQIQALAFPTNFRMNTSIIRGPVSDEWLAQGTVVKDADLK